MTPGHGTTPERPALVSGQRGRVQVGARDEEHTGRAALSTSEPAAGGCVSSGCGDVGGNGGNGNGTAKDAGRVTRAEDTIKKGSGELERQREMEEVPEMAKENEHLRLKVSSVSLDFPRIAIFAIFWWGVAVGDRKN